VAWSFSGSLDPDVSHLCSGNRRYGLARRAALRRAGRQDADSLWKLVRPPRPGLARRLVSLWAVAGFRANTNPKKIGPAQAGPFFASSLRPRSNLNCAGSDSSYLKRATCTALRGAVASLRPAKLTCKNLVRNFAYCGKTRIRETPSAHISSLHVPRTKEK
jgi:hypothetical protein